MSLQPPVNRREFIVTTAAVAGGLLVACRTTGSKTRDLGKLQEVLAVLKPTAYVQVMADGRVVCQMGRVEMGQGTSLGYAAMVAEELELDPSQVEIAFAPPEPAFINPHFGIQVTGASTSTATSWGPIRIAAATTREMLIAGAAVHLQVNAGECVTSRGRITHTPTGRSVGFAEIAALTAEQIRIPEAPSLRSKDFKVLGKNGPRIDERAKITGSAVFGIDVSLPGLRYAAVKRPAAHGAKIDSFDTAAAAAFIKPYDSTAEFKQISSGIAVVTNSSWLAMKAADRIVLTLSGAKVAADFDGSMATRAAALGLNDDSHPAASVVDQGDPAPVFAASAHQVSATYEVPFLPHVTLEPQNCTASFTGGGLEVWAPTQMPPAALGIASKITGLDIDRIKIHTTYIGGGFGRRIAQDYIADAVELSQALRQPVKVVWSREDDTRHDAYRPGAVHTMRASVDGGKVSSWYHRIVSPSVANSLSGDFLAGVLPGFPAAPQISYLASNAFRQGLQANLLTDPFAVEGAAPLAYQIDRQKIQWVFDDPGVPLGFWRSVGHGVNAFAVESMVDELALAAKLDPLALRQQMLAASPRDLAVLNAAAAMAGWPQVPAAPSGSKRGLGLALHSCFSSYCAMVIQVRVKDTQLSVEKVWCAVDCGFVLNPEVVRQQVEGGIIFGLTAATRQKITFKDGATVQAAMYTVGLMAQREAPEIEVQIIGGDHADVPPTGIGEVSTPAVAPALCAAVAQATGVRYRSLPLPLTVGPGRSA